MTNYTEMNIHADEEYVFPWEAPDFEEQCNKLLAEEKVHEDDVPEYDPEEDFDSQYDEWMSDDEPEEQEEEHVIEISCTIRDHLAEYHEYRVYETASVEEEIEIIAKLEEKGWEVNVVLASPKELFKLPAWAKREANYWVI